MLAACWAIVLASCAGEGATSAEEVVAIASEHATEIDSFERWARRVAAADTTFASRAALEEAAFAPVRRADGVVGAWIAREGVDPWAIAMRSRAAIPETLAWRRARLRGRGDYEVAVDGARRYVRTRSETSGGATLVVTLAFEPDSQ